MYRNNRFVTRPNRVPTKRVCTVYSDMNRERTSVIQSHVAVGIISLAHSFWPKRLIGEMVYFTSKYIVLSCSWYYKIYISLRVLGLVNANGRKIQ